MSEEEYVKWALDVIKVIDYDLWKECVWEMEDEGGCDLVDDVISILEDFETEICETREAE